MKRKRLNRLPWLVIVFTLLIAACSSSTADEITSEEPPPQPSNTPLPTTISPTSTRTRRPTNTPPQTGPLATAAALGKGITIVPPTQIGGSEAVIIADDDYVGIFEQAWNIVNANYVRDNFNGVDWDAIYDEYLPLAEDVQSSEELWDLLTDLILELGDSHSRFVPPSRMEAEFGVAVGDSGDPSPWTGINVWPAKEDEVMMIWCVTPGGPAARAGLDRGDHILAVDGEPMARGEEGFTRAQRIAVIFGTGGDTVTLTVQQGPDQAQRDVEVGLAFVGGCDGWGHFLISEDPRIGYIRAANYGGDASSLIKSALADMEADGPLDGLIFDQRHNPGGNSDQSIGVFTEGLVGTVGSLREGKTRTIYRIRGPVEWNEETPMVVLTDGNSHSAADYFPAAIQYLGRAPILGMPSAGNTEGINSFGLADGTLIRLAWTTLVMEDGTILEGVGVIPDIRVPLGDWGLKLTPYDVQLQAAIDYLLDLLN